MLEREVEAYLVRGIKGLGGIAYKFTSPSRRAVPDRLIIFPSGEIHFVEVKQTTGKLTPLQKVEIKRLIALKQQVYVLYGKNDVRTYIKMLKEESYERQNTAKSNQIN